MKSVEMVSAYVIIAFLSILSVEDIKHKQVRMVHFLYMCPIAILISLINIFFGKVSLFEIGLGMVISGVIALVGKVSKGLGIADVIAMFVVGIVCGGERLFEGIVISLLFVYGLAIIMMFRKKLNRRTTFPYIPFLNIGMLCTVLQGM